jgi:hypothetical protein
MKKWDGLGQQSGEQPKSTLPFSALAFDVQINNTAAGSRIIN